MKERPSFHDLRISNEIEADEEEAKRAVRMKLHQVKRKVWVWLRVSCQYIEKSSADDKKRRSLLSSRITGIREAQGKMMSLSKERRDNKVNEQTNDKTRKLEKKPLPWFDWLTERESLLFWRRPKEEVKELDFWHRKKWWNQWWNKDRKTGNERK